MVYGTMYVENAKYSADWYVHYQRQKISGVVVDIGSGMTLDEFVDRNILYFFYVDREDCRLWLKEGILTLKYSGIEPYRRIGD